MDAPVVEEIREVIAEYGNDLHLTDLHVSRVGKGKFSCFVAVQTESPLVLIKSVRRSLFMKKSCISR